MKTRAIVFALVAALGIFWNLPAWANIPTMTVSELRPGMQGVGRTVIHGIEIQEFNCEIIDVFKTMGYNGGPLILLRISGPVVDDSGGIAGGYSGTPVFIDGRLIGALSWGPYYTKGDVVGATPIDEMLKVFRYGSSTEEKVSELPTCLSEPIQVADRTFDSVMLAGDTQEAAGLESAWGDNTLILTPCRTPLIVSGLSPEGFDRVRDFAAQKLPYMDVVQGPGAGPSNGVPLLLGPTVLEPGASIGAQLASGDLDITAIGTLTWVNDDGQFLAFGHPFLADGETELPFVTSRILYTMPALDRSYKLGEPIETVGTVTQDRLEAIGGQLRRIPQMVNFHLTVIDKDTSRTSRYNYSVIGKEEWLSFLGWIVPIEGLTYGADRQGPGTCKVSFTMRGEGLAEPIKRENLVYAQFGVADESLSEFMEALTMVTSSNAFRQVRLTDVDIHVEVESTRQTMDILKARFQNAPNMGPGAVGYTGPKETDETQPQGEGAANPEAPPAGPEGESYETQNVPQEVPIDEMAMLQSAMDMMNMYGATPAPTKLVGYYPGDKIEVLVTLRPYREDSVERMVELTIPDDFTVGQTMIEVFGGTASYYGGMVTMDASMQGGGYTAPVMGSPETLDEAINLFESRSPNNSITVRLIQTTPQDPYFYLQDNYKPPKEISSVITTDEVVYGYFSLPIEILSKDQANTTVEGSAQEAPGGETTPVQEETGRSRSRNPHRH